MSFQSKEIFLYARGRSSSLQFGGRARSGTAEYLTDPSGWTRPALGKLDGQAGAMSATTPAGFSMSSPAASERPTHVPSANSMPPPGPSGRGFL